MNLCIVHGINNKFAYELFAFLQHHLLREPNCVASNYNVARVLTQKLKLKHEKIHACAIRCVLSQRDHNDDVSCPKCGSVQYKDVINKVLLMKVFAIIL